MRVNGKPAREGQVLAAGDTVNAYINDEFFEEKPRENRLLAGFSGAEIQFEEE